MYKYESLNPFGVREVSKHKARMLLLQLLCLNPFGVREVSKHKYLRVLDEIMRLNPFGVREVSKLTTMLKWDLRFMS